MNNVHVTADFEVGMSVKYSLWHGVELTDIGEVISINHGWLTVRDTNTQQLVKVRPRLASRTTN